VHDLDVYGLEIRLVDFKSSFFAIL